MIEQQAETVWRGGFKDGNGSFRSGAIDGSYSFASRAKKEARQFYARSGEASVNRAPDSND